VRKRASGLSLAGVADHLNQHGIRTPTPGRRWSSKTVRDALVRARTTHDTCAACGQSLAPLREAQEQERAHRAARRAALRAEREGGR
jgi:hypothetical protein